jgi:broad specificity phosphatase PhoE
MTQRTIYLVRHGRTALNAAGVLRGRLDPPLDEQGEREVQHLAERFRPIAIDHVVCSPLLRTRQTALSLALPHALRITVDPALTDRDYGRWAGMPRAEAERQYGSLDAAPGVESQSALSSRVLAAFEHLLEQFNSGILVIAGHDATNRALLYNLIPGRWRHSDEIPQPTACWSRLEQREDGWHAPIVAASPDTDPRQPR